MVIGSSLVVKGYLLGCATVRPSDRATLLTHRRTVHGLTQLFVFYAFYGGNKAGPGSGLLCHKRTHRTQRLRPANRPVRRSSLCSLRSMAATKQGRVPDSFATKERKERKDCGLRIARSDAALCVLCVLWRQQSRAGFRIPLPQKNAKNAKIAACESPGPTQLFVFFVFYGGNKAGRGSGFLCHKRMQ